MRKVLLAPGEASDENEVKKWKFHTASLDVHYVGKIFPGSAIYFYHIDSCLAVVFKLSGGSVVGGHAGVFYYYKGEMVQEGKPSLMKVVDEMLEQCAGQTISKVFVVGNTSDWGCNVESEMKKKFAGKTIQVEDYSHSINVVVDNGMGSVKVKVYEWVSGEENDKWMYSIKTPEDNYTL